MPTETSAARAWIDALPGGAFFFAAEVPGRPSVVRPLLSRLAASGEHPVDRQMQGFYAKLWHADDEPRVPYANKIEGALKLAGRGGGGASAFALHRVGWTAQVPCRYDFVTLGRPPTSPWGHVRFRRRSNVARASLTWYEVTLMEAVRSYGWTECLPWHEALALLDEGRCHARLGASAAFRGQEMLLAAETEFGQPPEFRRRLHEAVEALD